MPMTSTQTRTMCMGLTTEAPWRKEIMEMGTGFMPLIQMYTTNERMKYSYVTVMIILKIRIKLIFLL